MSVYSGPTVIATNSTPDLAQLAERIRGRCEGFRGDRVDRPARRRPDTTSSAKHCCANAQGRARLAVMAVSACRTSRRGRLTSASPIPSNRIGQPVKAVTAKEALNDSIGF